MIKLKEIISRRNFIDEDSINEFKEGFDLKLFLSMKSFSHQVKYANDNLVKIASGSGRIVYEIDDKSVLKLAKNKKGIAQNEAEDDYYINQEYGDIIAKVLERDENHRWVVSERAQKITSGEFKRLIGLDVGSFNTYIRTRSGEVTGWKLDPDIYGVLDESEFAQQIISLIKSTDISSGDFGRTSTYGKINDRIVIIDYGLTNAIYKEFYGR